MKRTTVIAAVAALTIASSPAHAFFGGNDGSTINHGGSAEASASQAQGQAQGQAQKQSQGQSQGQSSYNKNSNVNLQGNSQSVNITSPSFTYGAFVSLSSMANDRCGRVAVGIPFSAYTCNIIMEAETLFQLTLALYGDKNFAAETAIRHVVDNDRTMRTTMRRMGVIK